MKIEKKKWNQIAQFDLMLFKFSILRNFRLHCRMPAPIKNTVSAISPVDSIRLIILTLTHMQNLRKVPKHIPIAKIDSIFFLNWATSNENSSRYFVLNL